METKLPQTTSQDRQPDLLDGHRMVTELWERQCKQRTSGEVTLGDCGHISCYLISCLGQCLLPHVVSWPVSWPYLFCILGLYYIRVPINTTQRPRADFEMIT
jgi:hypothetical protein